MKRDAIERLAIDSAAGELSDDAQSLFSAYLAEHALANEWAQSILRVYRQTEAAISAKTKAADVRNGSVAVKIRPVLAAKWRSALRWAAIVCVAALLGAGAGRWSKAPSAAMKPERAIASMNPSAASANIDLHNAAGSFWRAKAAAMFEPRPYRPVNAAMHPGGLWQKYEDYIKEKHHE